MYELTLGKNGILVLGDTNDDTSLDVSESAIEYLFESLELAAEVTLRDVFLLIQKNSGLYDVFKKFNVKTLVEEAFRPKEIFSKTLLPHEMIDYLELSRIVEMPESDGLCSVWNRLSMIGKSFPFEQDTNIDGLNYPAGYVIDYSVCGVSPNQYIDTELRFNHDSNYWGKDSFAVTPTKQYLDFGNPALGQFIYAILYEFSYFGVGEDRSAFFNALSECDEWENEIRT